MDYYSAFKDSLQRVKATRAKRRYEKLPKMTPEQKQDLLERFHPDFRPEGFRAIPMGKNQGEKAPHELVDLLESPSRLKGISLDLANPHYKVDVLVICGSQCYPGDQTPPW
jgi:hypothetical protein